MGKRSTHNRYLLMRNSQLIMMQPPTKPNDNCMPPIPSIHLKFDNTILDSILSFFLSPSLRHDMCNSVLDDCPPVFPHLLPIVPISGPMLIRFLTLIHIQMCTFRHLIANLVKSSQSDGPIRYYSPPFNSNT